MLDVMEQLNDVGELYKKGAHRIALEKLQDLWGLIPEPKSDTPNSFLVITYATKLSLHVGDLDLAWKWAILAPKNKQARQDIGEAEFLVGIVAFERGDIETAREQLVVSNAKSHGRMFHGEDPKYKMLISNENGC